MDVSHGSEPGSRVGSNRLYGGLAVSGPSKPEYRCVQNGIEMGGVKLSQESDAAFKSIPKGPGPPVNVRVLTTPSQQTWDSLKSRKKRIGRCPLREWTYRPVVMN